MTDAPVLFGLVLAGGASRRMRLDKGALSYHGEPQAVSAWRLLQRVCVRAYVSINACHAATAPYSELPLIVDDGDYRGPAAGLEAAWRAHGDVAWLTLAVDMPLVDEATLDELLSARNAAAPATAFRHPDGTLEPLCAIWEPPAYAPLRHQLARGDASLRRFLEGRAAVVDPSEPEKLRNINDPQERAVLIRALGERRAGTAGY